MYFTAESGALLLLDFNLINVQWISLPTFRPISSIFLCQAYDSDSVQNTSVQVYPNHSGCLQFVFVNNGKCFLFLWLQTQTTDSLTAACHSQQMSQLAMEDVYRLASIFHATNQTKFNLQVISPQASQQMEHLIYKRIWFNNYTVTKFLGIQAEGFTICKAKPKPFQKGKHLFQCAYHELVSTMFCLDNVADCSLSSPSSADDETCPFVGTTCPHRCVNFSCSCSPVQYKSKSGICRTFISMSITPEINPSDQGNETNKTFHCQESSTIIHEELFNDLIVDCPLENDEPVYIDVVQNKANYPCDVAGYLPCRQGQNRCTS